MMAVPVSAGSDFKAGEPKQLFTGPYFREPISAHPTYDVSLDGQRFLMVKAVKTPPFLGKIYVTTNWFGELERLVP